MSEAGIEDVLLIGGASGTGKTTVGWEVSLQLRARQVAHWHVEGDFLDSAWPRPDGDDGSELTSASLRALAGVFVAAGYRRCVYVQTASVLDVDLVLDALDRPVRVTGVLLDAGPATRRSRLLAREIGSAYASHVASGDRMSHVLHSRAPSWVHRVSTDDASVPDLATRILELARWSSVGS